MGCLVGKLGKDFLQPFRTWKKSRTSIYRKNKHTHTHENHTEMMITWHILKGNTNF